MVKFLVEEICQRRIGVCRTATAFLSQLHRMFTDIRNFAIDIFTVWTILLFFLIFYTLGSKDPGGKKLN